MLEPKRPSTRPGGQICGPCHARCTSCWSCRCRGHAAVASGASLAQQRFQQSNVARRLAIVGSLEAIWGLGRLGQLDFGRHVFGAASALSFAYKLVAACRALLLYQICQLPTRRAPYGLSGVFLISLEALKPSTIHPTRPPCASPYLPSCTMPHHEVPVTDGCHLQVKPWEGGQK